MTSREEREALINLEKRLTGDLSQLTNEDLASLALDAELVTEKGPEWSGRLIALMKRRGLSWTDIVKLTGIPQTTLFRRAQPYM